MRCVIAIDFLFLTLAVAIGIHAVPPPLLQDLKADEHLANYGIEESASPNVPHYLSRVQRVAMYNDDELRTKYVRANGEIFNSPANNTILIHATPLTSADAHYKAAYIISQLVKDMQSDIYQRLSSRTTVGVFTATEAVSSFPRNHRLADRPECSGICNGTCRVTCTRDGRKYDSLAGSGGRISTVLSDNVMCSSRDPYHRRFNVLIHEYAHTIQFWALATDTLLRISTAYTAAKEAATWSLSSYAMSNMYEYFAQATAVFFNADNQLYRGNAMNRCSPLSTRCASYLEARTRLRTYDPALFAIIAEVYTDNRPDLPTVLGVCI